MLKNWWQVRLLQQFLTILANCEKWQNLYTVPEKNQQTNRQKCHLHQAWEQCATTNMRKMPKTTAYKLHGCNAANGSISICQRISMTLTARDSSSTELLIADVLSLSSVSLLCVRPSRSRWVFRCFAASNSAAKQSTHNKILWHFTLCNCSAHDLITTMSHLPYIKYAFKNIL